MEDKRGCECKKALLLQEPGLFVIVSVNLALPPRVKNSEDKPVKDPRKGDGTEDKNNQHATGGYYLLQKVFPQEGVHTVQKPGHEEGPKNNVSQYSLFH